ncbi:hypothetical protein DFS34DRAFT_399245 [Phlyctochytrium arcticum]|nr:hypothetical protein DFS34DRAFT_399245 [Phlyctochytrium arcticum]
MRAATFAAIVALIATTTTSASPIADSRVSLESSNSLLVTDSSFIGLERRQQRQQRPAGGARVPAGKATPQKAPTPAAGANKAATPPANGAKKAAANPAAGANKAATPPATGAKKAAATPAAGANKDAGANKAAGGAAAADAAKRAAAADAAKKAGAADAAKKAGAAGAGKAAAGGAAGGAAGAGAAKAAAQSDFCQGTGQKAGDGTQIRTGFCSSTPQGAVPNVNRMVSSLIVSPAAGATLPAGKAFTVSVQTANLQTGFFSDPAAQYYTQPQKLNGQGVIQGHQHITMQRLGAAGAKKMAVPDPQVFQFFKGLNEAADGSGVLSVQVDAAATQKAGPGTYRICSMSGSFGHQPLIMPVAQRGAQDDCVRVTIQ